MFPQIFGKYVLEREIAAGGMARVFLATLRGAEGFEKRLVVKQIRPELAADTAFVQRFVGEAKTAVELSHPNIVPVFELGVEQGVYYIAMEYCPGVTLADVLFETGPLEPDEGAYLGAEVCRALDYAHRRASIVHRDVTPRNVLVDDEGAIRLIDFGIAAPVEAGGGRAREVFGSPGHMPPEQLRGEELGPPADVFAVAVLLVEAWTGAPPFRRATPRASAEALKQPPPRIDTTLAELAPLAGVIEASLALEAARRPPSAEELGQKLREFLRSADPVAIARRLAARVQGIRTAQRRPTAGARSAESGTPKAPSVHTPSGVPSVTRTFAARDELVVWTRRLSSAPPPSGEGAHVSSAPNTALRSGPAPRRRRASFVVLAALALALVLVLVAAGSFAMFGRRSESEARAADTGAGAPATRIAPRQNIVATAERAAPSPRVTSAVEAPARRAPVAASGRPSQLPLRSAPQPSSSPAASAPAPVVSATLRLSADPPAVVSIEGEGVQQTSATPVRGLSLRPGAYRVTFRNETYGSPVATRVVLEPGGERSVHADFRAAEPRVTQR